MSELRGGKQVVGQPGDLSDLDRLGQQGDGPGTHGGSSEVGRGPRAHQHGRQMGRQRAMAAGGPSEQLESRHVRHVDIREQQIEVPVRQDFDRLRPAAGGYRLPAGVGHDLAQRVAQVAVVVGDQDVAGGHDGWSGWLLRL